MNRPRARKRGHSEFPDVAGDGSWRERRSPEARGPAEDRMGKNGERRCTVSERSEIPTCEVARGGAPCLEKGSGVFSKVGPSMATDDPALVSHAPLCSEL